VRGSCALPTWRSQDSARSPGERGEEAGPSPSSSVSPEQGPVRMSAGAGLSGSAFPRGCEDEAVHFHRTRSPDPSNDSTWRSPEGAGVAGGEEDLAYVWARRQWSGWRRRDL